MPNSAEKEKAKPLNTQRFGCIILYFSVTAD